MSTRITRESRKTYAKHSGSRSPAMPTTSRRWRAGGPIQEAHRDHPVNRVFERLWAGPPHRVDRVLEEGDEVAGFRVVYAPGHARGEVIFFRDSDRVAICGDVIRNMSFATALPGIKEPPKLFTYDPAENRRSIQKLAALEPSIILPGHGPPVTDIAAFERFVAALPA